MQTLAIATPSRGMIHSRTVEAVLEAVKFGKTRFLGWYITHDLPIPEAHEQVCDMAVKSGAGYIWLVEEDIVPPQNAISVMLDALTNQNAIGAFIDYPISFNPTYNCAKLTKSGRLVWCGTGCLLLSREVFEVLPRPWFEKTNEIEVKVEDEEVIIREFPRLYDYGGQDIHFTLKVYRAGLQIAYIPPETAMCDHLYLETWGMRNSNRGVHKVLYRPKPEMRL
jgi:hypothetical protein